MHASLVRWTFLVVLVLIAAATRIFQPMSNFTAMGALAVISALMAPRAAYAFLLTAAGMFLGDIFLGLSRGSIGWSPSWESYLGFGIIVAMGLAIRSRPNAWKTALVGLAGGMVFFLVTNGAVWARSAIKGNEYSADLQGLLECYEAGIPFYRSMLQGDLVYLPIFYLAMLGVLVLESRLSGQLAKQES